MLHRASRTHRLEEVIPLVINQDERWEVLHLDLPDGFHAEFGELDDFDLLDVFLGEDGSGAADAAEVKAAVLFAGVGDLLATIAFGDHDHAAAVALEEIDVAVHTTGGGRSKTAAGHAGRGFGGAGVIDGMIFEVIGQRIAGIKHLFELRMRDVAGDDNGAVDEEARGGGILAELGADLGHGAVRVDAHGVGVFAVAQFLGDVLQRVCLELLDENAVTRDLTLCLAIGGARNADADGQGRAVPWQADNAHVEREVFPAKLSADAASARFFEHLRFELDIAKGAAVFVAGGGQAVVILRRGKFDVFHRRFSRGATDNEGEMIRGTSGGAERGHFFAEELHNALRIQHRAGLLIEEGFVRRTAAFGNEEELICVAIGGIQIELRGQIGAGVLFIEHVQRSVLRIAQIVLGISEIDTLRQCALVTAASPDLLAFFAHDNGSAGVLAEWQKSCGGDVGVLQHRERDHAIVLARFRIIKDSCDLLEVFWAQEEIDVMKRLVRQQSERLGIDDE